MFIRTILLVLIVSVSTVFSSQAQLFENFESGSKASYTGASVTLSSGDWFLDDALIGNLSNDKFNGSFSVRMDRRNGRLGNMYMLFDKPDGANEVSFYLAHYGNNANDAALTVQYSTNQGADWTQVGEEIIAPADLTEFSIPVEVDGNIRFRFVQSSGTDRLNVDDIRITDFIQPADTATISVTESGVSLTNGGTLSFGQILEGSSKQLTIELTNVGNTPLILEAPLLSGQGFEFTSFTDDTLAFNETAELTVTFAPELDGQYQSTLTLVSNAVSDNEFVINLAGTAIPEGELLDIVQARALPLGTRVTVAGRVTVANEFGGPLYMQDATAGIAVFWSALHAAVEIGDSVHVSGPLTVFNPIGGADSDFLLQISDTDSDPNVTFEVIEAPSRIPEPRVINLSEMNSGEYEATLVQVQSTTIDHTGALQANTNYVITDAASTAEMRIDNNTNLVGTSAPTEAVSITGVVGKFAGIYQLLPRFVDDLGTEEVTFPGDSVSRDFTLDVVTWNVEWFGEPNNGPENDTQQFENVKTLITTLDADVYALQEISNESLFNQLDTDLTGYSGLIATFDQTQKTAFLYKNETVQLRGSGLITNGMNSSDWANGRFPFFLHVNATINNEVREIYFFNIHAKAFAEQTDYSQRVDASNQLKSYLDNTRSTENVIFLGDYNDEILASTYQGEPSPYKNFDDDPEYTIVTRSLEERGFTSFSSSSMIDHITFSSELSDEYFVGTERVENPFYIGSFLSETSDHFPVWVRFQWGTPVSNEEEPGEEVNSFRLKQNYPNPFNPSTQISYQLPEAAQVELQVYDLMGRNVATLVNSRQAAGTYEVRFDGSGLASGMYIYRLTAGSQQLFRKMMLIK